MDKLSNMTKEKCLFVINRLEQRMQFLVKVPGARQDVAVTLSDYTRTIKGHLKDVIKTIEHTQTPATVEFDVIEFNVLTTLCFAADETIIGIARTEGGNIDLGDSLPSKEAEGFLDFAIEHAKRTVAPMEDRV